MMFWRSFTHPQLFFLALTIATPTLSLAQPQVAKDGPAPTSTIPPPGTPVPTLPPLPSVDQAAFRSMESDMMPLTPEMIRQLHRETDAADRAAAEPPRFVPRPVSSSMVAVLSPGATPPVVRLFPNYVSNILFIDEVGHPLLIDAIDVPGKSAFTVTWSGDPKNRTNGVTISPNQMYATGNIAVHLSGVSVPVSVMLVSGQREVDTQAGIRVAGVGDVQRGERLPSAADAGLQSFLDGLPPSAAKPLTSSLPGLQVWSMDGKFVVRAPGELALVSPAWTQKKSSPDGTTVYVVPPVSPLMALSDGTPLSITVSGY